MTRLYKPSPWDIRLDLIDAGSRDFWRGLCVLLSFWRGSGTKIFDVAAHVFASSVNGAPVWTEGSNGTEMYFDGNDDAVVFADAPYLRRPSTAITLYTLYTNEGIQQAFASIVEKCHGIGSYQPSWEIGFGNFDSPRGGLRISGTYRFTGLLGVADGVRVHLWLRWASGGAITIHAYNMDGSLHSSSSTVGYAGTIDYSTEPFKIAESEGTANSEQSTALVAVWDRRLSDGEVARFNRDPFGVIRPVRRHVLTAAAVTRIPRPPAAYNTLAIY